ncbi:MULTISPECIES: hypothetical protein [Burkholderia]|uniref:hypothetical protein n=1 Tax=Burkholderia TaxID=32008 RepID=UPI000CFE8B6E|nr:MULTISPECIES: hypothetical protein [Burkholderia]MBJ9663871.1 hypothetical protein [Burkholderia gladioli]MBU9167284.1 hypothetical protein [Burkholderia gladioli]MBU9215965.1 hypothetical protein [Burkholderia gladioli]MBU9379039.1 hypothetical protein [Burkholderia gladioli]MDC6133599.1 hypothetical protein [Burkholderia gladioli]
MQGTLGKKSGFAIATVVVVAGVLAYTAYMASSGAQRSRATDETQRADRFVQACGRIDRDEGIPDCVRYYNDTLDVVYADKSGKWPFTGGPDQAGYQATYQKLAARTQAYNERLGNGAQRLELHPYPQQ